MKFNYQLIIVEMERFNFHSNYIWIQIPYSLWIFFVYFKFYTFIHLFLSVNPSILDFNNDLNCILHKSVSNWF